MHCELVPSPFVTEAATRVFASVEVAMDYFQRKGYIPVAKDSPNEEVQMSTATLKSDLFAEIDRLTLAQQERLLKLARNMTRSEGAPALRLFGFAGSIAREDLEEMKASIEER